MMLQTPITTVQTHAQEPLLTLIVMAMDTEQGWWEDHLGPGE